MKTLDFMQMEELQAGRNCDGVGLGAGIACGLSLAWPIGTALFGPSCVGLTVGYLAC